MTISVRFTRPGKGTSQFSEQLVVDRPEVKILLLDQYESKPVYENNRLILGQDAPIIWFVFPEMWYEIGMFHTTEELFTGWYTNICTPFKMSGTQWSTTDLFLDFWQPASGGAVWLDEDELQAAILSGLLDQVTQTQIQTEKDAISKAQKKGKWPPAITQKFNLDSARSILRSAIERQKLNVDAES